MPGAQRQGAAMPFSYYDRLSARNQAIYRKSSAVEAIRLPRPELLHPFVGVLREALAADERAAVEAAAGRLVDGLSAMLETPPARVKVLAVRPTRSWGELHGLYTNDEGATPVIRVWMRTARHRRVVAFRTFLRTLLHEVVHHLDYTLLRLADSFHTEGFFKRESSLFKQLVPDAAKGIPPQPR
jgi:hypothetical protein